MKIRNLLHIRSYLFEKDQCFIPICRARCCAGAPLPEGFAEKMKGCVCRKVYYSVNIGKNDPKDPFNSEVFVTYPLPLVYVGRAQNYHNMKMFNYNPEFAKQLGIKSKEEAIKKLMELEAQGYYNYCPFLNEYGRCQVYDGRPPICREFGTLTTLPNICSDKSSRWDIIKFNLKGFTLKDMFLFYKNLILKPFKKPQKS